MIDRIRVRRGALEILDQRLLPGEIKYLEARTPAQTAAAITDMVVRGAPLIGCTGAYGYWLASGGSAPRTRRLLLARLEHAAQVLKRARPTASALAYAVDRMHRKASDFAAANRLVPPANLHAGLGRLLLEEARLIYREDEDSNARMSRFGARLIPPGSAVMTVCNAGSLATAGIGTALGVIKTAHRQGRIKHVYACETRPYLQGARLTMFELMREKIPCTLITDNMAAHIMKTCGIRAVIAGADRIAANGDTANKIGTYMLAVLAKYHGIRFYIAAPEPTFDMRLRSGAAIPIEERSADEVLFINGKSIAPRGAKARHPAFDVTPAKLISAIITERGVISPVNIGGIARIFC
ncbi:MAG: S-methyl-5-thioribose-1-phosphate isomerase [Elusimicrobiales bacterium]